MSEFFAYLAAIDDQPKVTQRKALAVANKRVKDRFGAFMANATDEDRQARYALVEDDVRRIVAEVAQEYGDLVTPEHIETAIKKTLAGAEHLKEYQFKPKGESDDDTDEEESEEDTSDDDDEAKTSSTREARRPKMCPYHSEVVDISLGSGDTQGGYNAMASHAWGDNHCKGGFRGTCNFKPQMVTQKYWDDKQQEYQQRAEQRRLEPQVQTPSIETAPIMTQEPLEEGPGEGVTDIDGELAEAPSAVGAEPVMASTKEAEALTTEKLPTGDETALGGPSPKIDKKTWKPNALNDSGNLKPVDTEGSGSSEPTIQQDAEDGPDWENDGFLDQTDAVTESQELPTADETGNTTDRNIDQPHTDTWSGTEGQANPVSGDNPITSRRHAVYGDPLADEYLSPSGNERAPTNEDVLYDQPPKRCPQCGDPQGMYDGACRSCGLITSSVDPDKNPIREILETSYQGFENPDQVQSAINEYESS